jgi:hypothetical protein
MRVAIVLMLAAASALPQPAAAQRTERVLTIFGDDKCPENTICVRAPERDRYRIPKEFREEGPIAPQNQSWAARAEGVLSENKIGADTCSAVGAAGWTGCYLEQFRKAREEARQKASENRAQP